MEWENRCCKFSCYIVLHDFDIKIFAHNLESSSVDTLQKTRTVLGNERSRILMLDL